MEEVDIVDAHDNVVGSDERNAAHKKELLHRVVHVMVFDPDGRLFVQQRSLKKDLYPGFWEGSLSGHVMRGESYIDAAERELHEELGVCISRKSLKEVLLFGLHDERERVFAKLFVIKDFKSDVKLDRDEVMSGSFWKMQKVETELEKGKLFFHPLFKRVLEEFKAMKEKPVEFIKL